MLVLGQKLISFIDFLPFFIIQEETNNQYYYFRFYTETDWFIEIFPNSKPPDTDLMQKAGMTPTRMFMDGDYVQAPESPGLYARNRLVRSWCRAFENNSCVIGDYPIHQKYSTPLIFAIVAT